MPEHNRKILILQNFRGIAGKYRDPKGVFREIKKNWRLFLMPEHNQRYLSDLHSAVCMIIDEYVVLELLILSAGFHSALSGYGVGVDTEELGTL